MVVDDGHALPGPHGVAESIAAATGYAGAARRADPQAQSVSALPRRGTALPEPLVGPAFGSYRPDEVGWLLTDLSALDLEADIAERESEIQAGGRITPNRLPIEYQPDPDYQALFDEVLADTARRSRMRSGR